jgi:signal transduction histidine kinase
MMPARFTSLMAGHYPATAITRLGAAGGVETSLAAEPDLAALAAAALAELADDIGAEVGALWGASEENGSLGLLAVRGLAAGAVPPTVTPGEGLSGRAVAESRAVTATHGEGGMEVAGLGGPVRVAHEVHVPLRLGTSVLAVAALGCLAPPSGSPGERLARLQRLADAAGVALGHLQVHAAAQREARLGRAVLEATPDAIALVGGDGQVLVQNEPMRLLLEQGLAALDPPRDDPGAERHDEIALPGGRRVFARWIAPLHDGGETEGGRIVVLRDVTAERESERLKDEVLALVSHELRTPLTSVVGYVDLILDGPDELSPDVRRFLEVVERNARRLLRLVGDLLFVAQAEAGLLEFGRTEVDLGAVASDAVEAARPEAERAGATLVLDAEPVRTFIGDRDRCAQVLDNLISNAVKFAGEGGHIQVTVAERGQAAVLEVADDGPGIPVEEQAAVFERFARASNAATGAVPAPVSGSRSPRRSWRGTAGRSRCSAPRARGRRCRCRCRWSEGGWASTAVDGVRPLRGRGAQRGSPATTPACDRISSSSHGGSGGGATAAARPPSRIARSPSRSPTLRARSRLRPKRSPMCAWERAAPRRSPTRRWLAANHRQNPSPPISGTPVCARRIILSSARIAWMSCRCIPAPWTT